MLGNALRSENASYFVDPLTEYRDIQSIINWLLQKGMELSQTDLGNVQLMNWTAGCLEIKAHGGFGEEFLRFFERVGLEDGSACARALRQRQTIVIEDIMGDREIRGSPGNCQQRRRARCTVHPMVSKGGALFGVVSTHFPVAHRPSPATLRELQHAAQPAQTPSSALRLTKILTTSNSRRRRSNCGNQNLRSPVLTLHSRERHGCVSPRLQWGFA
jgi:GAF domain-containing protein